MMHEGAPGVFAGLFPERRPVKVVDVGAARFTDTREPYLAAARAGRLEVVGFEARDEARAGAPDGARWTIHEAVIGAGGPAQLRVCAQPGMSSLREPSPAICADFQGFDEGLEVIERRKVTTTALDDLEAARDADLIAIDVQGAEADVLAGAHRTLSCAVAVEIELQIIEQYQGQPDWIDLGAGLRDLGFILHAVLGYGSRPPRSILVEDETAPGSQWLWADALFIRAPQTWRSLAPAKLEALAILLGDIYGAPDMALHALSFHRDGDRLMPIAIQAHKDAAQL